MFFGSGIQVLFYAIALFHTISSSSAFAQDFPPHFGCGTYLVRGHLGMGDSVHSVLTLQYQSSSPFELILLGGDQAEKLDHVGKDITVRIYVPQPIDGNDSPFVFLQEIVEDPDDNKVVPAKKRGPIGELGKLEKSEACGLKEKFK